MDVNRNEQESCQRLTDDCSKSYREYHSYIRAFQAQFESSKLVNGSYRQSLLIDVHGQAHPEQRIELGYCLNSKTLNQANLSNTLNSTVSKLRQLNGYKYSVEDVIRGSSVSLGGIIQKKFGYNACPSPTQKPDNSSYFSGGYTVYTWSSMVPSTFNMNAIQIEFPSYMRNATTYSVYGKNIASCIFDYYYLHGLDKRV